MHYPHESSISIDNVQTLVFMVWCVELYTNRVSIFGGPEARIVDTIIDNSCHTSNRWHQNE